MDSFIISIMANIVCSILAKSGSFIKNTFVSMVEEKLIVNDKKTISLVADEIKELNLTDEMNEKAITQRMTNSDAIMSLVKNIETKNDIITQYHTGTGDNVAGDKVIHNKD